MTTDGEPSQGAAATERRWVLCTGWNNPDPEARSVLAVIETILAVVLYWWAAIHWETYWFLFISMVAAPLVLLRSPQSQELGVRWFLWWKERWGDNHDYAELSRTERRRVWAIGIATAVPPAFAATWWLTPFVLADHEGWSVLWRASALGVAVAAATAAVAGPVAGAAVAAVAGAVAGAVTEAVPLAVALARAGAVAVAVAVAAAAVVAAMVAGRGARAIAGRLFPGPGLGVLATAMCIRATTSLRHMLGCVDAFDQDEDECH